MIALTVLSPVGCRRHAPVAGVITTPATMAWPGVIYREVVLPKFPERERLWIYTPSDGHRVHPCVFVPAASETPVTGARLTDAHRDEHLPYVGAGYTVVAFDVSGEVPADKNEPGIASAIRLFAKRQAGLANARAAVDYALKDLAVDPLRLYIAGRGAAGTLALLFASTDSRVRGCLAYSPVVDVGAELAGNLGDELRHEAPETVDTLRQYSPLPRAAGLHCPLLLVAGKDEDAADSVRQYVTALRQTNAQVTQAESSDAVSEGIRWLGRDRKVRK